MRAPWTDDEVEMLQQMAVDYPPDRLPERYRNWASCNGYPVRTVGTIWWKVGQLRITDKACGEWVSSSYICKLLGVSFWVPHNWTDRYGIPAHRDRRGRRYFRRSVLRQVAIEQPERFAGIPADRLFLLLEDRELADSIAKAHPRKANGCRPVRCIETGWWYASTTEAAKRHNIDKRAIPNAIRNGGRSAGYHWTYA